MIATLLLVERCRFMLEAGSLQAGLVGVRVQVHKKALLQKIEFSSFGQFDNAYPVVTVLEDLANSISINYYESLNSFKKTVSYFSKSLQDGTLDRAALRDNIVALLESKRGVSVESTDNSFSITFSSKLLEEDIIEIITDLDRVCKTEVCRSWEHGAKDRVSKKPLTEVQINEWKARKKIQDVLIHKEQNKVCREQEFKRLLRKNAEYNDDNLDMASTMRRKKPDTFIDCLKGVWQCSSWSFKVLSIFPGLGLPLFIAAIIMQHSLSS